MARPAFGGKGAQYKEEEKKEEQQVKKSPSGKTLPQLVSVDLNLDSLKGFLEEI